MAFNEAGRSVELSEFGLFLEEGPQRILHVCGEIDTFTAPDLAERIASAFIDRDVILDFSNVSFMDSAGIGVLVSALKDSGGGASVRLLRPHPIVMRVLRLAGLDQHPHLVIEPD